MPRAMMLIDIELGSEKQLIEELKKIGEVKECWEIYDVYDIIAKIESDSLEKLKETTLWKICKTDNVRSTLYHDSHRVELMKLRKERKKLH